MTIPNDLTLITGAAGFIGYHVAQRLLHDGYSVLGADNLNDYYDVRLKESRLEALRDHPRFCFERIELSDRAKTAGLFLDHPVRRVVHLAAQAGVRYSVTHPHAYVDSNVVASLNIL